MSHSVPVLTIDGPSGVGKGTVARVMAQELGWHLLDSGALYRILALAAQGKGLDLADGERVAALAAQLDIRFESDTAGNEQILVEGAEISAAVRDEATGGLASIIAVQPAVRAALLQRQHDFAVTPGLVADGCDMGTVVFPQADLKLFMDASAEERARRRYRQLSDLGQDANIDRLCREIRDRDARDRNRAEAPLRPADDAICIDTTELSVESVLQQVRDLLEQRGLKPS